MSTNSYLNRPSGLLFTVENQDLTTATSFKVYYDDPDGVTGSWSGASLQAGTTNEIFYFVPANILNKIGQWTLYATAVYGGVEYQADPVSLTIQDNFYVSNGN